MSELYVLQKIMKSKKIKSLALSVFFLATITSHAEDKQHAAKHSPFSVEQLSAHLELIGGNWDAKFETECYVAFVFTSTNKEGQHEKHYYWSTDPSKHHQLFFMHDIEGEVQGGRQVIHRMKMNMTQVGVWKDKGDDVRTRVTIGGGIIRNEIVPYGGSSKHQTKDLRFQRERPVELYSWSSNKSKEGFTVEILFATDKTKAEQVAAPDGE